MAMSDTTMIVPSATFSCTSKSIPSIAAWVMRSHTEKIPPCSLAHSVNLENCINERARSEMSRGRFGEPKEGEFQWE